MIKIENLCLKQGDFELKNIDIDIKEGAIHAILGPSGAGKSTILNAILGLKKIDSGKVFFNSQDITNLAVERRGFGYVPQKLALFPHMSVKDNILYGIKASKKEESLFEQIVKSTNVSSFLNRYPNSLSGGEKQRVALARAFVIKPKLLLLDEPFNALDTKLKKELWQLLKEHSRAYNSTVIIVTHDLNEAYYLADSISVVIDGKVAQNGAKEDIFNTPTTLAVAKYLGINNIYSGVAKSDFEVYIEDFDTHLQTKQKLNKKSKYSVVIKNRDINFATNSDKNIIEGSYSVMELEYYDIVTFKPLAKNVTIEFIVSKDCIKTNYIQIAPKSIICYEK